MKNTFTTTLNLNNSEIATLEDSFRVFTNAMERNSVDSYAYFQLGRSLHNKNHSEAALTAYNKALSLESRHATLVNYLGEALFDLNRYNEAADAYNTAISLGPKFIQAHVNLSSALYFLSKTDEALEIIQKALVLDPEHGAAYYILSLILRKMKKDNEADEALRAANKILPDLEKIELKWQSELLAKNEMNSTGGQNVIVFKESFSSRFIRKLTSCWTSQRRRKNHIVPITEMKDEKRILKQVKAIQGNQSRIEQDAFIRSLNITTPDLFILKDCFKSFSDALELNRNDLDAYRQLGLSLEGKCQTEAALTVYNKALSFSSDDAVLLNYQGEAMFELGQYEEAIEAYRKAISLDPKYLEAHLNLALTFYFLYKICDALDIYYVALELDPLCSYVYIIQSLILHAQNKTDEASQAFKSAGRLFSLFNDGYLKITEDSKNKAENINEIIGSSKKRFKWIFWYLQIAALLGDQTDIREVAMKICGAERDSCPHNFYAQLSIVNMLFEQSENEEVVILSDILIKKNAKNMFPHYFKGLALFYQNKFEEADKVLRDVISINSRFCAALCSLGNTLSNQDKNEEALEIYAKVLEINPQNTVALYQTGYINNDKLNKIDEAYEAFMKLVDVNPQNTDSLYGLGMILWRQDKFDEALVEFRKVCEIDPQFSSAFYEIGCILFHDQDNPDEAEIVLRKAIEIDSQYTDAYYKLGLVLRRLERTEEALAAFRTRIDLDPSQIYPYSEIFDILVSNDEFRDASHIAKQAMQNVPDDPSGYDYFAQILDKFGNKKAAHQYYLKAVKLSSKDDNHQLLEALVKAAQDRNLSVINAKF